MIRCSVTNTVVEVPDGIVRVAPSAFGGCSLLSKVKLPEGLEIVGKEAFANCGSLTDLNLPESVTNIGEQAFLGCTSLPSIAIPSTVEEIGERAFFGCHSLALILADGNGRYEVVNGILYDTFENCLVLCPAMKKGAVTVEGGTVEIAYGAFSGCHEITSIILPSTLEKISIYAFSGCAGLTSLRIPAGVWSVSSAAFDGCTNLVQITVDAGSSHFRSYDGALYEHYSTYDEMSLLVCPQGKTSLYIPSREIRNIYPDFKNCSRLEEIIVSSGSDDWYSYDGALYSKDSNMLICCPKTKKSLLISPDAEGVYYDAFDGCSSLTEIRFTPSKLTPSTTYVLKNGVLYNYESETAYVLPICPASVTIASGIAYVEFCGNCKNLLSLTIPESVTELYEIGYCKMLTKITVAKSKKTYDVWPQAIPMLSDGENSLYNDDGYGWDTLLSGWSPLMKKMKNNVAKMISTTVDGSDLEAGYFSACKNLRSLTILDSYDISKDAFTGCVALTNIVVGGAGNHAVIGKSLVDLRTREVVYSWEDIVAPDPDPDPEDLGRTIIIGAKCEFDTELIGYKASGLPTGLSYNSKTGKISGTVKKALDDDEVEITFSKSGEDDVVMTFVVRAEKTPTIACEGLDGTTLTLGVTGGSAGIPLDLGAESGIKSVTATKLPTGMKIASIKDKTSWYITGAPTKAGTYEVAITLTTAAGNKVTEKFTVTVAALPSGATGTFNGFVLVDAASRRVSEDQSSSVGRGEDAASTGETLNAGTLQVTVSDVGKITAKVVAAAGTYSFTATGWDSVNEGVYSVKMTTKKGDVLTLACDSGAAWNAKQMTGTFSPVDAIVSIASAKDKSSSSDAFETNASTYAVEAQKNAFGKQWFFSATGDDANGWTLSFAENAKAAALTVTLNADGKTSVAGKLGAYKITASGYADVSGIGTGAIFADFAPVVTVGKAKKVLSFRANLWFDKKNDHEQGVGSAVFVP